ncbi:Asp23/Gls24 family envelope stress response protein [Pseudonocardia endophytica]|uniref:Putative alkaline shock family protein YloU n=1 Tax=Pseudonocardia endophytica TaxID=401976 RepID=A0A4V2PIW5_PSEEN|nr:Asp23/Gls24 family envelope stress response protein [Pseudonocardia endophytica]TCK26226.1 putative alkaline shock family protein YloU [Pseudonocardia endophytica]
MSIQDGPDPGELLRCGRHADALLDQVAAGQAGQYDAHQSDCVHCQAALAEYERLWAPMRQLAAQKIAAPEGRIDRIMQRLRGALSEPDYALLTDPAGTTRIAARVILVTARHGAQAVPGVRVALSRALDPPSSGAPVSIGVVGESVAIEITLAADYGRDLALLAEHVRTVVADRIHRTTGLHAATVTVIIDDVLT